MRDEKSFREGKNKRVGQEIPAQEQKVKRWAYSGEFWQLFRGFEDFSDVNWLVP